MSSVQSTQATQRTVPTSGPSPAYRTKATASLLPASGSAAHLDPMMMLTVLTAKQRDANMQSQTKEIQNNKKEQEQAFKDFERAMAEAKKSREKSSFWGDVCGVLGKVATVAAVIGAVASCVATGGVSLPAVLALSSVAMSGLATLNKECGIIKGDVGDALNTGLAVGAAVTGVASAGAGILNVGVSATAAAGQGASAGANMVALGFKHDEDMHTIDGERSQNETAKLQRQQSQIIKDARAIAQSYQRSIETMLSTMGEAQRTQQQLASSIRG
jgi:hypothetical protein